jgi:hypothetical protein
MARQVGRIQAEGLVECSGMDVSLIDDDLIWAVNDGGNGPFLYALGTRGDDRGRIRVVGARNRDWEGLDTFMWQDRPMILIADIGDNRRTHEVHHLYGVQEPRLSATGGRQPATAPVSWRIAFSYPDERHDAEGVCVDAPNGRILVLTKRDTPPILFELPLQPTPTDAVLTARRIGTITHIPPPTDEDRKHPYGHVRSQPTAMDMTADGGMLVVLTYKHAYLCNRSPGEDWEAALNAPLVLIPLPLPQACRALRQREAVCFARDGGSLWVSSEGRGAGLFRISLR